MHFTLLTIFITGLIDTIVFFANNDEKIMYNKQGQSHDNIYSYLPPSV